MTKEDAFNELLVLEKMEMDTIKQINYIISLLNNAEEIECVERPSHPERRYNHPTVNSFYYRKGIEGVKPEVDDRNNDERLAVICIIDKNTDTSNYTIIDMSFYEDRIKETGVTFNYNYDKKYISASDNNGQRDLHQLVLPVEKGKEVDHISCNGKINIRKLLRECIHEQNSKNVRRKHIAKKNEESNSFSAGWVGMSNEKKNTYREKGYHFKEFEIISPEYKSEKEMYEEMKKFELERIGAFRYDPYLDFTETWYVLVFWKVLGVINFEDVKKYQQEYFGREYIKAKEKGDADRETELKELLRRDMYDYYETII
ncbi:MAG: hypothetical protein J6B90_05160 [Lachnospiraceae bacterium]|nr:hypothetical protein [Lachnospiraceae bacterium]